MFLKFILVQKVGFVKYKSGPLHGHKMKIIIIIIIIIIITLAYLNVQIFVFKPRY